MKAVSNANYLWIQYFYSYLNERGRAGFVMASSASDAGHGEKEIREELIATGNVDMIISIGTNFFYTKSLPCTLWFFDKGKPRERQDKVLMIDARNIYQVVTRKIRDFSEEQLQNITAITWLYRGQQNRFLALVGEYLNQTHSLAANIENVLAGLEEPLVKLSQLLQAFSNSLGASLPLLKELPQAEELVAEDIANENVETFRAALQELETGIKEFADTREDLISELQAHLAWFADNPTPPECRDFIHNVFVSTSNVINNVSVSTINESQKDCATKFAVFIPQLKTLQKHINEVHKLTTRAVKLAEKKLEARKQASWNAKEIKKQQDVLDTARDTAISTIKSVLYMKAQVAWLQTRFPEAALVDVPGLCKVVTQEEIAQQDCSLTPGRYVGVGKLDAEDEDDFEERLREIHLELASLNEEAVELAAKVKAPGVVTGRSGTVGFVMYVQKDFWPLNTTLWIKEFKKVTPPFAYCLLSQMDLNSYQAGAAVPTLNRNIIHGVKILLPGEQLQRKFDNFANSILIQIELLKKYNYNLRQACDLLLPRLMNGSIAV